MLALRHINDDEANGVNKKKYTEGLRDVPEPRGRAAAKQALYQSDEWEDKYGKVKEEGRIKKVGDHRR